MAGTPSKVNVSANPLQGMSSGVLGGTGAPGVMVVAELDPLQKSMQALTLKLALAIISAEKQRSHWRRLNYGMKKSHGRSARVVSNKMSNGLVVECEGQEKVEEAMWSVIHDKRFNLPEKSPICKGKLRGEF